MPLNDAAAPPKPVRAWAGWLFAAVWLVYLGYPLANLFDGKHSVAHIVAVLLPVALFSVLYVSLAQINQWGPYAVPDQRAHGRKLVLLGGLATIALILPILADRAWVVLWIYVSSSSGYSLPLSRTRTGPAPGLRLGLLAGTVLSLQAIVLGVPAGDWLAALVPALVSCAGTVGVRRMQQLILELREARAEVARLAASEERLRMARDLHDLAGHSLATITLKAELARKLMAVDPARAEQQILDLEHVSRQALADIREAVSGYRRATLAVETASARTALTAADIDLDADPSLALRSGELAPEVEEALAWCLREAVTNVVRHSGARGCRIRLIEARVDGESTLTLEVLDDGTARARPAVDPARPPSPAPAGNGLSGLRERLHAVSPQARLTAEPAPAGGFRLTATVPLDPSTHGPGHSRVAT
jgi:two-component system sensor histidine kinase DesK